MKYNLIPMYLGLLSFTINPLLIADDCSSSHFTNTTQADYVIVGVGTAGAVLAKRLSDDKKTSVIALHNGKNLTNDPLIKYSKNAVFTVLSSLLGTPLPFDPNTLNLPPSIKKFLEIFAGKPNNILDLYISGTSTPQPNADNKMILWEYALPEGGASSINAGAWCRGTNEVYSQWETLAGPEWSVDRITNIYKELEDYHGLTIHPSLRGKRGPISVRQVPNPSKFSKKFSKAIIASMGVPYVLDYNDTNTPIGASPNLQYTQSGHNRKYRVSSATAFLNKHVMTSGGFGVKHRKLRVLFESTALKTIWEGNKAIGVEYVQNGQTKQVFANKGVIVCAGLISSSFLMHSGVGPQALLQSLNIPVIYDNPNVGQALADQPSVPMIFLTNPKDWQDHANAIFNQIAWLPAPGGNPTSRQLRISGANILPKFALVVFDLCQPKSRGSITINSPDPLSPPVIDLGTFTDPSDFALYQAGFSIYIKALVSELQAKDPKYELISPDPAILDDPILLSSFIKSNVNSNQCFQSHCRMAPLNQGGVVDSTGHVYGVQNLIVADDSCVPQGIDGTPMATAYLIAANIARLLGY